MTNYTNPWTGKPVDTISDLLPRSNGQTCDECGSPCIDNCIMCGAPQCCPACCYDATPSARITGDKDRENPVEGAPYGEGLIGRIDQLQSELLEQARIIGKSAEREERLAARVRELEASNARLRVVGDYLDDIKQEALTAGAPGQRPTAKALAHIVRLCIDARQALADMEQADADQ